MQLKSGCVTHACLASESVSLCIFAYLQLIMHTEPLFARASVSIAAGELRFRRIQGHVCFIFESNTLVSCDGALAENGQCWQAFSRWVCVFVLECYHCARGMEERRWRGFRKSTPNKVKLFQSSSVCSYWISAAPLITSHSCPLVSHHPSGVHSFCSFMSFLSSCFFVFFSPSVHFSTLCLRWEPRPSWLVISPSAITSLTVFFSAVS